jgi:hypothetical protein
MPDAMKSGCFQEAGDGTRTHDTWLGKPVLYQLSYARAACSLAGTLRALLRDQRSPRPVRRDRARNGAK